MRVRELIQLDVIGTAKGLLYEIGDKRSVDSQPIMDGDNEIGASINIPGPWVVILLMAAGWSHFNCDGYVACFERRVDGQIARIGINCVGDDHVEITT